jgi:endonuclease-8
MPEGDSIRRVANRLAPLVGKTLERVTTQGLERGIAGQTVTRVDAHGKHLLIDLENQTQIRVHLGMNGRVRYYDRAAGDAVLARMSPGRASLALIVANAVYVWVQAKTVEIADRRAPMRGLAVASLGADILSVEFDAEAAAIRAAEHAPRTIADVLLDQRVVAGIGNIFKCEALHAGGVDPRTRVGDIPVPTLAKIFRHAQEQMQTSVDDGRQALAPREPVHGDRFAVYSRSGKPCKTCGTTIESYQLGDPPRWTWSCPRCQPR